MVQTNCFTAMRIICLALIVSFWFTANTVGQTKTIQRLKQEISSASSNQNKMRSIVELCDQGYSLHPDTLIKYALQINGLAEKTNSLQSMVRAKFYISSALTTKGLIDSSMQLAQECMALLTNQVNDPLLQANVYNQMGRCFMRKNQYKEAIGMGYKVITIAEKSKDVLLQLKGKTLIGWAYLEMGQTREALNWHLKALYTTSDTLILEKYGILFANLAINYGGVNKMDSGFYYIHKAVRYSRKHENLFALSNSLAIEAQLYVRTRQTKLAEQPLKEVVEMRKLIGDPFYIVSDMAQLALYYAHFGQPEKGIALCEEGIKIANNFKIGTKLFFLYSTLGENYKAMNNTGKYAEVLEKIIALKDSVYNLNSAEAIAEMQTKYDLQRKENIIIQQKLDIITKDYILYGSLILVVFGIIISLLIFRDYKRKQELVFKKMREEEKLQSQVAVLVAQENERKRIAADLHDNMGAYASAISANVDDMMMMADKGTSENILESMKNNASEIMLNLRDTIWVLNKESIFLTGVSDRFKSYVQKIRDSYPGITIEIQEDITNDISLSPESALNMLRILQEAFHNAIKHSGGNYIIISISCHQKLKLSISDNGRGILSANENTHGSGIQNLRNRAKANGWSINFKSHSPAGTLVELSS